MLNISKLVLEAQRQLVFHPIDLAHDITHHNRVYEWSMTINKEERLNADVYLLTVCAWYHDIGGRKGEDVELIKKLLGKNTDDTEFINKVITIIKEHSFGEVQTSLESKILFDADKLEYVNPFRLLWFLRTYKDGLLTKDKYEQYMDEWNERAPQLQNMLNFHYTRTKFLEFLPSARSIMKE